MAILFIDFTVMVSCKEMSLLNAGIASTLANNAILIWRSIMYSSSLKANNFYEFFLILPVKLLTSHEITPICLQHLTLGLRMFDQLLIGIILVGALVLFVWDKWRYDLVAMFALLVAAALGLVPANEVFAGFGNAAVITVAAVLVISHAMWRSGVVDALASVMKRVGDKAWVQMLALTSITTLCSAFISNTG